MVNEPASTGGTVRDGTSGDGTPCEEGDFRGVRAVADAVLYEGYLLYPYRRSSPKNRVRWQFGVLTPRRWAEADGPVPPSVSGAVDTWYQQTECLLEADHAVLLHIKVRFLHLQRKIVQERAELGGYRQVASLEVGGTVHLTFDEAVPCETDLMIPLADVLGGARCFHVGAAAGTRTEPLPGGAGRVVRRRERLDAVATVRAERLAGHAGLYRLAVRTENTGRSVAAGAPREEALRYALIATHTCVGAPGAGFVSLLDPPAAVEAPARACRNLFTFPVLAGEPGCGTTVLSSPVLLPDHPEVAPESPGDLHDAAEIDEILTLRTLLLTDREKREARATDARAAAILDRTEGLSPEDLARLHGGVRGGAVHPG